MYDISTHVNQTCNEHALVYVCRSQNSSTELSHFLSSQVLLSFKALSYKKCICIKHALKAFYTISNTTINWKNLAVKSSQNMCQPGGLLHIDRP